MPFSVLGTTTVSLPVGWTDEKITSVLGSVSVEAGQPGPDATLRILGVVGSAYITVPEGTQVRLNGTSLLGKRTTDVPRGDGPTVNIIAFTFVGEVKVTHRRSTPA